MPYRLGKPLSDINSGSGPASASRVKNTQTTGAGRNVQSRIYDFKVSATLAYIRDRFGTLLFVFPNEFRGNTCSLLLRALAVGYKVDDVSDEVSLAYSIPHRC